MKKKTPKKRNYKKEYAKFQSSTKAKKDRASRNKARRAATKAGRVCKGDGKDVHHTKSVRNNKATRVMSKSKNRGMAEKSRLKGSKRKKK
jgi:hypothetical protein